METKSWQWNGARWWKLDLHTHTPASDDYGKGPDQELLQKRSPREWLLDYMRAGIDCVAVTDHNTGAWIDPLQSALAELGEERPEGFRPLVLFPGVEISAHGGIHILAILDPDTSTADIDTLLGAVGFSGKKGSSAEVTSQPIPGVVQKIKSAGGIAIPAHVDKENGLFRLAGQTLAKCLERCEILEMTDPSSERPAVYREAKRTFTEVLGSDAHHPHGKEGQRFPGSHFTWVKMARPGLGGLRLALLDGLLSVRRSDGEAGDPNERASRMIESIQVADARYVGRPEPFRITLNPWLNAFIGGRGTGKSTLVELTRLALRRRGELPETLHDDFEKYWRAPEARGDEGLLTPGSRLEVIYRKDGVRYRIQWSAAGDLDPIQVEDGKGGWKQEEGDVQQRFPIRIYSQKQIFELAKDPLALLRIVDEAPDVGLHEWEERWREEENRFLSLRAKAREIEAGLADEDRVRGDLKDVKRLLKTFEDADHASVLREYQRRLRQTRALERWEESWVERSSSVRALAADLVPDPLDPSAFDESEADRELLRIADEPVEALRDFRDKLEDLARNIDQMGARWAERREGSAWKQAVDGAITAYEDLERRLEVDGAGAPSEYGTLVQRRQALEARLGDLAFRKKRVTTVRADAEAARGRLLELRRERTRRRQSFLEKTLEQNEYVRIRIVPYGAGDAVEGELRSLIQVDSGRFGRDIGSLEGEGGMLGELYAGSPDAGEIENRLETLKKKLQQCSRGDHEPGELKDSRFAKNLSKLPPEVLDRLDTWFPEDTLSVEYSTAEQGASFRPLEEGSPGQKTAALLAFLLSYGSEPIVLDQPEDDLDNHLIYELIVAQLRDIKQRRQVVAVTHNANIVVNGDAELVVELAVRKGQTRATCEGSLQDPEVRGAICKVMEGGRTAFEQRYRRIVLEGGGND